MADPEPQRVTPVILCGGAGTRLWPLSRRDRPKQMLALTGSETMLRQTARRVSDPDLYRRPIVVGAEDQGDAMEREVEGLARLILEPSARSTAPAIALAALAAEPDELLLVLPSDHLIADRPGFDAAVRRAVPFARDGWIVTFGMAPNRPEPGFGYIRRGASIGDGIWAVARFVEKPEPARAEAMLAEGGHDWNGGIFLMRADALTSGLEAHAPKILAAVRSAWSGRRDTQGRSIPDPHSFAAAPAVSIDYALMEKSERIAVVPVSVGWSDVGSWAALHELARPDEAGNVLSDDAIAIDSQGCLIRSEGPLVVAMGVTDLVIIATADAILVMPRSRSQDVKQVVDRLEREGRTQWT